MKIKKVISCILTVCVMLGALSLQGISSVTGIAADGGVMRDNMTAQDYADEMGLGINLGNTMEAYDSTNCESINFTWPPVVGENTPQDYERCWGAEITTQEIIDGMKDAGFNTVRIPVFWGNMMENDGNYNINADLIARVKEIVDYCRKDGLYAVINIHHYDEFIIRRNSKEKSAEIFTKLWTQIANYFKDYSDYLVFEGYNEYLGGGQINPETDTIEDLSTRDALDWTNTLNQVFVDAVRATGGNNAKRMLIASGCWTNIDKTTGEAFKMPTDTAEDRLMVSVHYVDNSMYWTNQIGSEYWESYSLSQLKLLKKAFYDKGIPVFIGETTTSTSYASDNGVHMSWNDRIINDGSDAMDHILRLIKSYGFVPVLWDTNDNFYSRTDCKIKSQTDAELIQKLAEEIRNGTIAPPEEVETFPKEDALAVIYWDDAATIVSGVADKAMNGATQIRYIFDCAQDVSFNSYTNLDLSATVAGTNSSTSVKGNSDITGTTENSVALDLKNPIKTGDSYSISMYTNSWGNSEDYIFLIRCVKFLDTNGNVIKTIDKTNKPTPAPASIVDEFKTRSAADVAKDKSKAQNKMKQAKITKLKVKSKSKKKILVTWKKISKAVGYEVQVAKKKKFKDKQIVFKKITSKAKITAKNPKIKRKKTYFVRVRAYATYRDANYNVKRVYSRWVNKVSKVKVK